MEAVIEIPEIKKRIFKEKTPEVKITLTLEQKTKILVLINADPSKPPSLKELTDILYPGKNLDGRSAEGKAVKEYCVTLNVKTKSTFDPKYTQTIELTDSQKLYIRNNASTLSPIEMARAIFVKDNITKGGLEYKVVYDFLVTNNIQTFDPELNDSRPVEDSAKERFIPKTLAQAARKVNECVLNAIDVKELKKDTRIQNYLQSLIRFCHKTRYGLMINVLANGPDLKLFQDTFISNVWDKPDLSEEEIDQYINLCCDIVNYTKMQRDVERMSEMRDKCLDDSDGKRLSMSLVQQMGELYKEMDNNFKRQNATTKVLTGTRNDRMEGQKRGAMSVSQLVETWRDKQKRDRLIALAEKRKELVRSELDRLDTLDAFKCEIWGLNKESF